MFYNDSRTTEDLEARVGCILLIARLQGLPFPLPSTSAPSKIDDIKSDYQVDQISVNDIFRCYVAVVVIDNNEDDDDLFAC